MSRETEELQKIIDGHKRIVFFGGAGVSTESGIPDFRSQDGLYNMKYKYPPELIISHSFFMAQPEEFYRFYRDRILITDVEPNPAHRKLAELERAGKLLAVVTQNIDGLHQKAGSRTVYELHGSIHRNYCTRCGKFFGPEYLRGPEAIPKCDECGGTVKPDVVLYEEGLDDATISGAVRAISEADCLIIGGTSLVVYPAAGLIDYFSGDKLVLINKSATTRDESADLVIREPIGEVFSKIEVR
ncbi:MAG: NAD-dependent protein deacylase [Lachnospiraceae bacterium]|nr:NAD-dependent protein deacylase [Lachnospiraceae bacterium]